jgi:hypothetical protein
MKEDKKHLDSQRVELESNNESKTFDKIINIESKETFHQIPVADNTKSYLFQTIRKVGNVIVLKEKNGRIQLCIGPHCIHNN